MKFSLDHPVYDPGEEAGLTSAAFVSSPPSTASCSAVEPSSSVDEALIVDSSLRTSSTLPLRAALCSRVRPYVAHFPLPSNVVVDPDRDTVKLAALADDFLRP